VRDQPRLLILMLFISAGAVLGANLRFLVYRNLGQHMGLHVVNIVGSFLFGLIATYLGSRTGGSGYWGPFLLVGALGSFTTFSSYTYLFLSEIQSKQIMGIVQMGIYHNIISLLAIWLGISIGSWGAR